MLVDNERLTRVVISAILASNASHGQLLKFASSLQSDPEYARGLGRILETMLHDHFLRPIHGLSNDPEDKAIRLIKKRRLSKSEVLNIMRRYSDQLKLDSALQMRDMLHNFFDQASDNSALSFLHDLGAKPEDEYFIEMARRGAKS